MKRKLIVGGILLVAGYFMNGSYDFLKSWYNAPPAPPGAEAAQLSKSLREFRGWKIENKTEGSNKGVWLVKGPVAVKPCSWKADVVVNQADANDNFSSSDLKEINEAARSCLRQLTISNLDEKKSAGVDGDSYVVSLPDGSELRIQKKEVDK